MLKSAAPTQVSKRVTFHSLGLDRAMAENDLVLEQNDANARRASCGMPTTTAGRTTSGRSTFSGTTEIMVKEDVCMIYSEGLPELPGNRNILRFSHNHCSSSAAVDKQLKMRARSGRQTPLPPSGIFDAGLQGMIENMDVVGAAETDEVITAVVIEEDEREEEDRNRGLADLGNAPPLVDVPCDELNRLDVSSNGDKRKSTPPDLLALSQMYFERNQVALGVSRESSAAVTPMTKFRKFHSVDSALSPQNVKASSTSLSYNLGIARPRKLTPLINRPAVLDAAAQAKESGTAIGPSGVTRQALHMPVKYSSRGSQQTSRRPSLEPITVAEMRKTIGADDTSQKAVPDVAKTLNGRKKTYVVTSNASKMSSSSTLNSDASDDSQ